jgi:hypothetical protein
MAAHWSRFACTALLALSFVAACGDDDGGTNIDAPGGGIDAPGGDGDAGIDAAGAPSCTEYCDRMAANCTSANLMYASRGDCEATCGKLPPGTVGMMSTNTMGCRHYHAGAAATNANLHCRHAGPGGDGACGANCEGFCTLVLASCTGGNQQYGGSMATCMSACAQFSPTPDYVANATGDNLACRLYHATAAAANPNLHCGHTAMTSSQCTP